LFLVWLNHTTENEDLLGSDLDGSCMNNPEFHVVSNVVDGFPDVSFDIKCFHLFYVSEGQFVTHSGLRFETLATNDENVLFIELANTERLSGFLKIWEHDPFLFINREKFASA
jgi:hypothetical protein